MKYTPQSVVKNNKSFLIPIYQRLFEWSKDNVLILLNDLGKAFFVSNGEEDYHIGMLTSTKNNELVDGQQRFTVMMLMGCVLQQYDERWKSFLLGNDISRLTFLSRPVDNHRLSRFIENGKAAEDCKQTKMGVAIDAIDSFMIDGLPSKAKDYVSEPYSEEAVRDMRQSFARYVFEHLCFFIEELPEGYGPKDLNQYFERMNTTGKNLESHEILKVKLIKHLDGDRSKYMLLWNKLAETDTLLVMPRDNEDIRWRKDRILRCNIDTILAENLLNGMGRKEEGDSTSIISIASSTAKPGPETSNRAESRCVLSFPNILLQALYYFKDGCVGMSVDDFFNTSNLLGIFEKHLPFEGEDVDKGQIKSFLDLLTRARLALDICFVRTTDVGFDLDMCLPDDNTALKNLMMYQSMLYVSSSNTTNYKWFGWLMDYLKWNPGLPDANKLFKWLWDKDRAEHIQIPAIDALRYPNEVRYWFWRLDYHIWRNRDTIFKDNQEARSVAANYIFRRNRSLEHIAPQTPLSNSDMVWADTEEDTRIRNSFGNLVMISQGLNSTLKNQSYGVKKAHVTDYMNGSKTGSIESLKLLMAYADKPEKWTRESIKEHGDKMYNLLMESIQDPII